jgi:hypothetical protein
MVCNWSILRNIFLNGRRSVLEVYMWFVMNCTLEAFMITQEVGLEVYMYCASGL